MDFVVGLALAVVLWAGITLIVGIIPMIHRHRTTKGLQQTDKDVHKLLTPDETIVCIARQGNISGWKDTVVATNNRIIIHRVKWRWWGKAVFEAVAWEDVQNATIDGLFSVAHFRLTTTGGRKLLIGNLVKEQARMLLTICHERIKQGKDVEIERVDEGQDTMRLDQIARDVHAILAPNETITYIAHQSTGFLGGKDAVVVTNKRVIIYRIKVHWSGENESTFESVAWKDVWDVSIHETFGTADFRLTTTNGRTLQLANLVKEQAQALLAICKRKRRKPRRWQEKIERIDAMQDTTRMAEIVKSVYPILKRNETIIYAAHQAKGGNGAVIVTNRRIIIYRIKMRWSGGHEPTFEDTVWKDVQDVSIDETFGITDFRLTTTDGRTLQLANSVKEQAQELLAICKERTEAGHYTTLLSQVAEAARQVSVSAGVDLETMTPSEFEKVVARLYEQMGFNVDLTQHSHDGGVDLYARRTNEAGVEGVAVQCKHYSGTVGVAEARALFGVVSADQRLARGVLVTSGSFSAGCRLFVEGKRIDLIDRERLRELLDRYGVQ